MKYGKEFDENQKLWDLGDAEDVVLQAVTITKLPTRLGRISDESEKFGLKWIVVTRQNQSGDEELKSLQTKMRLHNAAISVLSCMGQKVGLGRSRGKADEFILILDA